MKTKRYAVVDQGRCVSCGECMRTCPKGAIAVIDGCYAFADRDVCVGCGLCSKNCPAGCIDIVSAKENEHDA